MSYTVVRRVSALAILFFLIAFLIFSPFAELYGEHEHGCSVGDCLICLVANALSGLRETYLGAMICSSAILLFIHVCEASRYGARGLRPASPVALKTEILS